MEQQVVALGDNESGRGRDRETSRYRRLDRPVESGPENRRPVITSHAPEKAEKAPDVERLRGTLHASQPERIELLIRKVEAVQRRDGRESGPPPRIHRVLHGRGDRRLAGTGRSGDSEQESAGRAVDRLEQVLDQSIA